MPQCPLCGFCWPATAGALATIDFARQSSPHQDNSPYTRSPAIGITLSQMEGQLIAATLRHTGGNIRAAAAALGINRSTMYQKIKRYHIPNSRFRDREEPGSQECC